MSILPAFPAVSSGAVATLIWLDELSYIEMLERDLRELAAERRGELIVEDLRPLVRASVRDERGVVVCAAEGPSRRCALEDLLGLV